MSSGKNSKQHCTHGEIKNFLRSVNLLDLVEIVCNYSKQLTFSDVEYFRNIPVINFHLKYMLLFAIYYSSSDTPRKNVKEFEDVFHELLLLLRQAGEEIMQNTRSQDDVFADVITLGFNQADAPLNMEFKIGRALIIKEILGRKYPQYIEKYAGLMNIDSDIIIDLEFGLFSYIYDNAVPIIQMHNWRTDIKSAYAQKLFSPKNVKKYLSKVSKTISEYQKLIKNWNIFDPGLTKSEIVEKFPIIKFSKNEFSILNHKSFALYICKNLFQLLSDYYSKTKANQFRIDYGHVFEEYVRDISISKFGKEYVKKVDYNNFGLHGDIDMLIDISDSEKIIVEAKVGSSHRNLRQNYSYENVDQYIQQYLIESLQILEKNIKYLKKLYKERLKYESIIIVHEEVPYINSIFRKRLNEMYQVDFHFHIMTISEYEKYLFFVPKNDFFTHLKTKSRRKSVDVGSYVLGTISFDPIRHDRQICMDAKNSDFHWFLRYIVRKYQYSVERDNILSEKFTSMFNRILDRNR